MEKEQRKRTEMIPYLQDTMEETFQCTCREIQTVLDTDACRIWRGFHDAVCECLETAGALQRQNQKGRLGYLAFSMMRHALWLDRLELRIDALDDGFYMDTAEASAYYHADFLQDRFIAGTDQGRPLPGAGWRLRMVSGSSAAAAQPVPVYHNMNIGEQTEQCGSKINISYNTEYAVSI